MRSITQQQAVVQTLDGHALNPHMMRHEAVAGEGKVTRCSIQWRGKQGITHCLPPVLPTGIKVMIVVIIASAHLIGKLRSMVVIHGTRLIIALYVFINQRMRQAVLGKLHLQSHHAVQPTVLEEHHRVVFKKMVVISAHAPILSLVGQREEPTAKRIACRIEESTVGGVATRANNRIKEVANPLPHL